MLQKIIIKFQEIKHMIELLLCISLYAIQNIIWQMNIKWKYLRSNSNIYNVQHS